LLHFYAGSLTLELHYVFLKSTLLETSSHVGRWWFVHVCCCECCV